MKLPEAFWIIATDCLKAFYRFLLHVLGRMSLTQRFCLSTLTPFAPFESAR